MLVNNKEVQVHLPSTNVLTQLKFKTMDNEANNKQFYGVELEVETGEYDYNSVWSQIAYYVQEDFKDTALLKMEGLDTRGFEIVTAPATLNYHKQELWNNFFSCSSRMVKASPACGLHIHFSIAPLSKLTLAKVIYFYHNQNNASFLSKIAGRAIGAGTSRFMKPKSLKAADDVEYVIKDGTAFNTGRGIISVSSRNAGKTCEVRMFQSNTTRHHVIRAIEFVDAVIEFCKVTEGMEEVLDYTKFIAWFDAQTQKYPELSIQLKALEY